MAALYPNLTENLIPVAADWKVDWIIANTFLQKDFWRTPANPSGMRIHAMLTYRTAASFTERFGRTVNSEKNCSMLKVGLSIMETNWKVDFFTSLQNHESSIGHC